MIEARELREWLDDNRIEFVAVDDGGLTLVGFAGNTDLREGSVGYIEVGGIPLPEESEEKDHITESQEWESIDGG